jgi:hypothetical protein
MVVDWMFMSDVQLTKLYELSYEIHLFLYSFSSLNRYSTTIYIGINYVIHDKMDQLLATWVGPRSFYLDHR